MPRGKRTTHNEVILTRTITKLRHEAQVEAWAWRFATHRIRPGWHQFAACRGTDTDAWFDEDRTRRLGMLPICQDCPVRIDCGTEAMETEQRHQALVHGVRAGFGAFDRFKQQKVYDALTQSA